MDTKMKASRTVLRCNRRGLLLMMFPWLILSLIGSGLALAGFLSGTNWSAGTGIILFVVGLFFVVKFVRAMGRPRLAIERDAVRVNLSSGPSHKIPIDCVECLFLGQGPSGISSRNGEPMETSNVIVRLAEAAKQWHHRDVKRSLGHWCEGYITLNGTWCEPISLELVNQLNHQLAEAKRSKKAQGDAVHDSSND